MSSIHYERRGQGEQIVLIHGIGHRGTAWGTVPQLLAADHEVFVVDLPGHGNSPRPAKPGTYAFASVIEQLEEFFAEIGPGRPHVAGNSLGGLFSLMLGERQSVSSVTALAPAGFATLTELLTITGPQLLALRASVCAPERVLRRVNSSPRQRRASLRSLYEHGEWVDPEIATQDALNLRRSTGFWPFFYYATFTRCPSADQVPVTVAWGDQDHLLIPRQGERARRAMPDQRHVTLSGCGHVPMVDDPEQVAEVIRTQVASASAARTHAVA